MQVSAQVEPLASVDPGMQAALSARFKGGLVEMKVQELGVQARDPVFKLPALQLGCVPDKVYPGSQVMAHDAPCGNTKLPLEQTLPNFPLAGGDIPFTSQDLGMQEMDPGEKVPALQTPLVVLVAV